MRKRTIVVLAACLTLTACGGNEDSTAGETTTSTEDLRKQLEQFSAANERFRVVLDDCERQGEDHTCPDAEAHLVVAESKGVVREANQLARRVAGSSCRLALDSMATVAPRVGDAAMEQAAAIGDEAATGEALERRVARLDDFLVAVQDFRVC